MKKQQFSVSGTSCRSCEVIIERELTKQSDIYSARVSHTTGNISMETTRKDGYRPEELTSILGKHGYTVSVQGASAISAKTRISWQRVGAVLVLIASVYIILDQLGVLRFSPTSAEPASLLGVFFIGVVASVSSCTAVVAGLVAAISGKVASKQEQLSLAERIRPHVLFNIGRIGGFILLGAFIGYLGSAFSLNPSLNGLLVLVVAVAMILIGVNLLEVFPSSVISMPKWLAHRVHDLAESKDPKAPLLLGAGTFFLPCGFTQSMQLFALTLQDPVQSGLVMGIFAVGTAPVLLGIGSATSMASGNTLKKITQTAGLFVVVLGISNVLNGLALVGFNPNALFVTPTSDENVVADIVDGRQRINMAVTEYGTYEPSVLYAQAGVPVDWYIEGADFMGCANSLILPTFGVNEILTPGENLVQFTPTKSGKYTFSCSMGMVRGTMIVTAVNE